MYIFKSRAHFEMQFVYESLHFAYRTHAAANLFCKNRDENRMSRWEMKIPH